MKKIYQTLAVAAAVAAFGSAAQAQNVDYPTKRVTIIVPYSAGGATDILARQIAKGMSEAWDQTVTVENRPGAGATLGTTQAAKAKPDGYTLFMGQVSSHGIAPAVYSNLQYDARKDFAPIIFAVRIPNVMVVPVASSVKSVQEFVDEAKKSSKTFGSSGTGSSIHLSGEMFKSRAGLDMTHVPYRGSGEAVPALVSGNIDVMFDNMPSAMPQIKSGTLRALAVTSPTRDKSLPDVPTLAESGVVGMDGFSAMSWFGLLAPAGTNPAIINKINVTVEAVLQGKAFQTYAANSGATVIGGSPQDFAVFIDAELIKWAEVVKKAGVSVK
jgi:tripartite-type tricarboxylate transporter receptor subunit TctC